MSNTMISIAVTYYLIVKLWARNTVCEGTPDSNGVFPNGDNFSDGQAVIYHATGGNGVTIGPGIADGGLYYVHRLNAYQIQLADSLCHAVGCPDPDGAGPLVAIGQLFLTLSGDLSATARAPPASRGISPC